MFSSGGLIDTNPEENKKCEDYLIKMYLESCLVVTIFTYAALAVGIICDYFLVSVFRLAFLGLIGNLADKI